MGFVGDLFGGGGDDAADAAVESAEIQAEYQREALDYLKEREIIPQQFREGAIEKLGGLYGLEGGVGEEMAGQERLIADALSSPLYGAIMGGQEAGEESILRSASATGGLRSGNVQGALYDYNTQLQNQALLQSYNQQLQQQQNTLSGLGGLAQLPSGAGQIAGMTSGIGGTLSAGKTAQAQALEAGKQQGISNIMGLGSMGVAMFSDRRLKTNIKYKTMVRGWKWYTWDWNIVAQKMGLKGSCQGCMADEVYAERPDAVVMKDLFMMVLYGKLGVMT